MSDGHNVVQENIISSMTEGVVSIGFDGFVRYSNEAAAEILGLEDEEMTGKRFLSCLLDEDDNDEFIQSILDSFYDRTRSHVSIVPYKNGGNTKKIRLVTSYLKENGRNAGVVCLFSDLSELYELRDAVKSMERIQGLNRQLEMRNKLLSETFGRFLSDEIVKELLDTPGGLALGGKKRDLTIIMSDIRGFTALSERMDPVELITMLNHYLAEMTDIIQSRKGTIIEFLGDGIFAIFGAPEPCENHASEAVAAALEMQARMEAVNKWNIEHDYPILEMGIGINSGEVIVGNIGSEKRTKYGVVGSNVNLAGRIESYTIAGQILISESTAAAVKAELVVAKELMAHPKGVDNAIKLRQITGIGEPYNIKVEIKNAIPQKLKTPVPVAFYLVEDKHTSNHHCYGGIVGLADDAAVLDTDSHIEIYANIQIEAGGELYGKVMEKTDDGYIVRFTSVPGGYKEWLIEHVKD